jgi:hypothetical protein
MGHFAGHNVDFYGYFLILLDVVALVHFAKASASDKLERLVSIFQKRPLLLGKQ